MYGLSLVIGFLIAGSTAQAQSDTLVTESGLKIIYLDKRKGDTPSPGDRLKVHYISKLMDGRVIETSIHERPYKFRYGKQDVLPAWEEALGLMTRGDRAIVIAPPELAFGDKGIPYPEDAVDEDGNKMEGYIVPPNATLVFKMWLMEIGDTDTYHHLFRLK